MNRAGFALVVAVSETIREAREVPAGLIYVALLSKGVSLADYNAILQILSNAGLVSMSGDLIRWTGPEFGARS